MPEKKYELHDDFQIQIDVKNIMESAVVCNMYTGVLCAEIMIKRSDYDFLVAKGFFVRDGKEKDGAGIYNTTETYRLPVTTLTSD